MRDAPSRTAEAVCLFRASDQIYQPEDRILDDPHASIFLGRTMRGAFLALRARGGWSRWFERASLGLIGYVLARHRFMDERLVRALEDTKDPIRQVVLLGAGYDTRAYRFAAALRGRPVFEVDWPATSRRKDAIVRRHAGTLPPTNVRRVEIDFLRQVLGDRLATAGFERGARTFFIWEGVSMYLNRATISATLDEIRGLSGPGSEVTIDFWYLPERWTVRRMLSRLGGQMFRLIGEPLTFTTTPPAMVSFLEQHGFATADLAEGAELARRYVRGRRPVQRECFTVAATARA